MFMFGIKTLMFALGIIALVLGATVSLQIMHQIVFAYVPLLSVGVSYACIIIGCLMVRLHNIFMSSA
jgi:hypothetical protein